LAALAVVAYHALQWGPGGFDVGRAGVDVFFVISGFIIWRVTAAGRPSPAAFLWRRLIRVAPLYWLTTLAVAGTAAASPNFLPQVSADLGPLLLSLAFLPHLDPRGLPFPTLPPGWTLNYEAMFYLVFACALAAPRRWRALVALGVLMAVTVSGFVLQDPAYLLGANPMLLQFAAGVALGWVAEHEALPGARAGVAMMLCGALLLTLIQTQGLFVEFWRPFQWGVPALLLVAGAVTVEAGLPPERAPSLIGRLALTLGDASYAIYVLHLPVTAMLAHTIGPRQPGLFLGLCLIASTLAGLAGHILVERPLRAVLRAISLPAAWTRGSTRYSRRS
jgi:exopolysaccharide production protein ExoZ